MINISSVKSKEQKIIKCKIAGKKYKGSPLVFTERLHQFHSQPEKATSLYNTFYKSFSSSLIIHQVKTKKTTTVFDTLLNITS